MAVPMDVFIRELKAFDDRRVVVKTMRRRINEPLPEMRRKIRQHAVATLPHRGGLGGWAAKSTISSSIRYASARSAGVKLKGSRKSTRNKSDLNRLDAGTVRAPSWGHRTRDSWHTQAVPAGWFTEPASDNDAWAKTVTEAVDEAFDTIRRG